MNDLTVKDAQLCDTLNISDLEKKYIPEAWSEALIADEIGKENSVFLIAEMNSVFCGYISGENIAGEFYINNVCVDEKFRRKNIGTKLLVQLCDCAERLNCEFITLEVRSLNTAACALYEKCGFSQVGRRKGYYSSPSDDALIYTKYFT